MDGTFKKCIVAVLVGEWGGGGGGDREGGQEWGKGEGVSEGRRDKEACVHASEMGHTQASTQCPHQQVVHHHQYQLNYCYANEEEYSDL